ncbi:hypothetical protein SAMN06265367_1122 [Algoriphagus winogradskyi]|uniref:Secreted protein n=1 Tax=Algoriphagus winogradskyi TaxID=237017 RepID=A0ABY1PKS9_9BACT|nr:hypothetical protein SAMN06265367_1122 [Algoriphagus winogradskyi]
MKYSYCYFIILVFKSALSLMLDVMTSNIKGLIKSYIQFLCCSFFNCLDRLLCSFSAVDNFFQPAFSISGIVLNNVLYNQPNLLFQSKNFKTTTYENSL